MDGALQAAKNLATGASEVHELDGISEPASSVNAEAPVETTGAQVTQPNDAAISGLQATQNTENNADAHKQAANNDASAKDALSSGQTTTSAGQGQGSQSNSGQNQSDQQGQNSLNAGQANRQTDPGNQTDQNEFDHALAAKASKETVKSAEPKTEQGRASNPLTPERLSGFQDTRGFDDIASGLGTLRGEHSSGPNGILAPKGSPGLAQNVANQLNLAISRAVEDGESQFTLRLNPAELGRVTVKLNFNEAGNVRAHVLVQNPETLELLQRDVRGLERAIETGGHKLEGASIEMSLDKGDQESAGRAMAEAMMEEKMRDELAAQSANGTATGAGSEDPAAETDTLEDDVPLEDILPYVTAETGVDIRI